MDNKDVDSLFYASVTADILKSKGKSTCQFNVGSGEQVLTDAINEEASTVTIYHAVAALSSLGKKGKCHIFNLHLRGDTPLVLA